MIGICDNINLTTLQIISKVIKVNQCLLITLIARNNTVLSIHQERRVCLRDIDSTRTRLAAFKIGSYQVAITIKCSIACSIALNNISVRLEDEHGHLRDECIRNLFILSTCAYHFNVVILNSTKNVNCALRRWIDDITTQVNFDLDTRC